MVYIDNWSTSEFGDISLDALDGAKYLQDLICPGMVSKDTTSVGIIRRLLDNVGFTNYNVNYKTKVENGVTVIDDESILSPIYWWTDDGESVWNAIQEICRDSQMVATFDENNILQFYTRDYLFKQATTHWNFKYAKDGSILPNLDTHQCTNRKQYAKRKTTHHKKQVVCLVRAGQYLGSERTYHQRVGNTHQNNAQLTQNDGISQLQGFCNLDFIDGKGILHGRKMQK